jgi:hypothetical protein
VADLENKLFIAFVKAHSITLRELDASISQIKVRRFEPSPLGVKRNLICFRHLLIQIKRERYRFQIANFVQGKSRTNFDGLLEPSFLMSASSLVNLAIGLDRSLVKTGLEIRDPDIVSIDQRWENIASNGATAIEHKFDRVSSRPSP